MDRSTADILERAYISLVLPLLNELPQGSVKVVELIHIKLIPKRVAVFVCKIQHRNIVFGANFNFLFCK